jgi:hypothetical protein
MYIFNASVLFHFFLNFMYDHMNLYVGADLTGNIQDRGQEICIYEFATTGLSALYQTDQIVMVAA